MKNLITYLSKKSLSLGNGSGMIRECVGIDSVFSKKLFAVFFCIFIVSVGNAWCAEEVIYTLTPAATGSNSSPHNAYASAADFECDDITWSVTGNSYMVPWRIGGKNTSNTDRVIYSKNPIPENVTKIIITHGAKSSGCTVNSMKVLVSTAANGGGTQISNLTVTYVDNGTVTVERPAGKDWTGRYYKITYNYKSSSSSTNHYVLFSEAEFYTEAAAGCSKSPTVGTVSANGPFNWSASPKTFPLSVSSIGAGDDCTISEYGFVWKSGGSEPTISDNKTKIGESSSATSFSGNISGSFAQGTTYKVKAYVTNDGGKTTLSSAYTLVARSVTFNMNGHGVAPATQYVANGEKATQPANPSEDGWTFGGWYKEAGCSNVWNFSTETVTSGDKTIYAKWTEAGKSVSLTKAGQTNGTFTLSDDGPLNTTSSSQAVTVTASPAAGYYLSNLTASNPATGTATVTGSGNTRTVTYSSGANGSSTITATFSPIWELRGSFTDDWVTNRPLNSSNISDGVGTISIDLEANTTYFFKFYNVQESAYYKNVGAIVEDVSGWDFTSGDGANTRLFTGKAGTYTFKFTLATKYLQVIYPTVSEHPNSAYNYFKKNGSWGSNYYVHWWDNSSQALNAWGSDHQITKTTTICDEDYIYFPILTGYPNMIVKDNYGDTSNKTGDLSSTGNGGKYNDGSSWHSFIKYSISYDKGTGESGSMSPHTELCPGSSQALSGNNFSKPHYHFTGWVANVDVTINSATVTAGTLITGTPTIQNIQNNIILTAQWEINSNTLTWNWGGGSTTSTSYTLYPATSGSVNYGATITYPANISMSKDGYAFNGWSSSPGTMPDNNLTLTAQWQPKVTWMAGGSVFNTQSGTAGTALTDPGTPSNSTYCDGVKVFVGWSAEEIDGTTNTEPGDLFTSVAGKTIPAGGITYYAVFATSSGGGSGSFEITMSDIGSSFSGTESTITKLSTNDIGYVQLMQNGNNSPTGWNTQYLIQFRGNSSGHGTIYNKTAISGLNKLRITTQNDASSITVYYGSSSKATTNSVSTPWASAAGTESVTHKINSSESTTTDNLSYYDIDIPSGNNFFYLLNGTGTVYIYKIIVYYSTTTYSAYATTCCQNWSAPTFTYTSPLAAGGSAVDPTITGDTYGTPTFSSSNTSAVTVIASGANAGRITPVGAGTAKITATWPGDGTHCSKSVESNTITVTGNFSVSFNANGGTGSMSNQSIPFNTATNLTANGFTAPSCKEFYGWATSQENADNDVRAYTDGQSVTLTESGLTLYAIWHTVQYTVARGTGTATGCSGGTFTFSPSTVDCGGTVTITSSPDGDHSGSPTVTILPAGSGTVSGNTITNVVGNITSISVSYAEKADVTATWNVDNGSVTGGGTTTQKEGTTFTFPNVTSTDCGTFLGWTDYAHRNYNETSGKPSPFYNVGSTIVLDANTQFYAVYSKVGDDAVAGTLYHHEDDGTDLADSDHTGVTATGSGLGAYTSGTYYLKFDGTGDNIIFELDGTPTSFNMKLKTMTGGSSPYTAGFTLYESDSKSGPWTAIGSEVTQSGSSTAFELNITNAALFSKRVLKVEMTTRSINAGGGEITINGLRAPLYYTTSPGCVDWVLDAINVTTAPTKTTYDECELFDPAGMVVTGSYYEDGNPSNTTTKDVAGYTWSPEQFLTPGNTIPVTISYTEKAVTKTTTSNVRVNDLTNYTITFHDGGNTTTWTQSNHCDACNLDSRTGSLACGDYTFAGWSSSSTTYDDVSATISTWVSGSYTPTANTHLYAVYRKGATPPDFTLNCEGGTFYIYEANGNTHMAGRVNATPRAYTSEYWNNDGGTGCVSCLEDGDDGTPFTFTRIADNTYKIQNHDGEYLRKYSSGNHPDFESTWYNEDNFKWIISAGTNGTWRFTSKAATDYALVKSGSYFDFQLASNVTALSSYYDLELSPAASTVYQSNPNCGSPYTIIFDTHGGSFVQGNYAYSTTTTSGLTDPTVSKFPSATMTGCTFVGWKDGNAQDEIISDNAEGDMSDAPAGLYAADADLSVSSNKTYHAVYHYYDDNWTFDPSEGGTYHLYTLISGTKHYIAATPTNSWAYLTTSTDCGDVKDVTITPGTGANAGKYSIAVDGYTIIPEDGGTKFKRGDFWWTITDRGDGTYAINGMNANRNIVSGSSGSQFEHTAYNAQGAYSGWYYPYIGRCREHHWTSDPTVTPLITLGQTGNIRITSTNGKTIKATNKLTLSATRYGTTTKIYLSANVAGVGFLKADGTTLPQDSHGTYVSTESSGELATTNIVVTYSPTVTTDGIETVTITAQDNSSPSILATASRTIHVRHLPAKFLIATKVGDDWYALPNNMTVYGNPAAIKLSSVNESTGVATYYSDQYDGEAVGSKNYLTWALYAPVNSDNANYGYKQHGDRLRFADTYGSAHYLELKASDDDIKNSVSSPNATDHPLCELLPGTDNLIDYTLYNEGQSKYLGVDGSKLWGAYVGSTTVRFLIPNQQAAPDITWYNDMLDANHATNKAENGVVTLPTGADPVSCNTTLLPTFCGWKDGAIATYVTSAPTYVQAGDVATTDKTYYAVFKHATLDRWYTDCPTIYTITYTANGGTGADHLEYTMTTTADAITVGEAGFSKEGCTFVGWTNPDDVDGTIITPGAGKITGLSGDITLNAVWIGTTTITGTVRLTTAAGEKVATGAADVTISSTDFACATALRITYKDVTNDVTYGRTGSPLYSASEFRLCNGSYSVADGSNISLAEVSGSYNQTFSITYEPNGGANTLDEYQLKVEVLLKNTVIDTKTLSLYGRTLPASFAIAIKIGGSWYALPNNMDSEGTYDPILISVTEDASVLNWTAQGPSTVAYKMKDYTPNYSKLRFAANDANENCLWAATGNSASIRNWSPTSTASNYAWTVTPDANFNVYTMANLANTRTALKINDSKWEMYNTGGLSEIHFIPLTTVTPLAVTVMEWGVDEIAVKTVSNWTPSAITAQISGGSPSAVTKTSIGGDLYKLTGVGDLQGNPGEPLALNVTDGGAKQAIIQIPFIVTDTKTEADLATILKDAGYAATLTEARSLTKNMDVIVRRNGTLSSESSVSGTFQNVYIYPGGKADFTKDISIQNLYMRGGFSWLGGAYAHPQMNVASTASISGIGSTGHGIFYDLYLDNSIYYVFALPKDVSVTTITNEENGDDWDAWIKSYSGEGRTLSPKVSGWSYVTSGSIARGAGYEIAIKPRLNRPYGILRFPLLKSTAWSTETDCTPEVTGWGANNTNVSDNNKGWNFIGNPFLTAYNNAATPGSSPSGLIQTKTLVPTDTDPWDGKYQWATSNVKYFTVPRFTEYEYDDVRAYPYKLDAFFPFFIQATGDGTVTFDDANKTLKAPVRNAGEPVREVFVDFQLSNSNGQSDVAGLTISNQYSDAFDMNDKEKTIQNGNSAMKVYTLVGEYRTAFNALTEATAALPIPVGVIAPAAGTYRFTKLEDADYTEVEHLWLTDYTQSSLVDLLVEPFYEFTTVAGRIEDRFAINATLRPKHETTTGTEQLNAENDPPMKFIWQDKMYILRGGVIYDATGKKVKEINK